MSKFIELDSLDTFEGIVVKASSMPVWLFALCQAKYKLQHDDDIKYMVDKRNKATITYYELKSGEIVKVWEKV